MNFVRNIINRTSLRHQLFVMGGAGFVVMILALTLTSTYIANNQIKNILLHEGFEHTSYLADNSVLAILYSSTDNAKSAIDSTLEFSGIEGLAIYNDKFEKFVSAGELHTPDKLIIDNIITKTIILDESSERWHFVAPVILRDQSEEVEEQLFKQKESGKVIGYAYIVMSKSTLNKVETVMFRNNLLVSSVISIILLVVLHWVIRSITSPLKNISHVMRKTEMGEYSAHVDDDGPVEIRNIVHAYNGMVAAIRERDSELRKHNIHLEKQAIHDHLTGLMNRIGFEQALNIALEECNVIGANHALCYMDLDRFKIVNDTCGHNAGDELLKEIANMFRNFVRKDSDTLARVGGDEFALILKNCTVQKAKSITENICKAVNEFRFTWDDKEFSIGVSIGIIPLNEYVGVVQDAVSKADAACYVAKERGRGQVHIIAPDDKELGQRARKILDLELITEGVNNGRFELFRQAIHPLKTNVAEVIKVHNEILLRICDESGKHSVPCQFLETAERYNLSLQVDLWVVEKVFDLFQGQDVFKNTGLCMINLSGNVLSHDGFIKLLQANLDRSGINPGRICFEIKESSLIGSLKKARLFVDEIHKMGFLFSLDNFGSGTLSFEHLKQLGADYLKVDGAIIKDIVTDPVSYSIAKAINDIGHVLKMKTVAKHVENTDILQCVTKLGFDYAQGFALDKPVQLKHET